MDDLNASNATLEQKTNDLADARKNMYKANDYILDTYFGADKASILRIRRLRDLILLNLHNARRGICKMIKNDKSYIKMIQILKYLRSPPYSTVNTPELQTVALVHAEQVYSVYEKRIKDYNMKIQEIQKQSQKQPQYPKYPEITEEETVAQLVIQGKKMCTDPNTRTNLINGIGSLRKMPSLISKEWENTSANIARGPIEQQQGNPFYKVGNNPVDLVINATDWNALMDELEKIFMDMYSKTCSGGYPNYLLLGNILESWINSFCQDSGDDINNIITRPLDSVLVKSSALFL